MVSFFSGAWAFVQTALLVFTVLEVSALLDEVFSVWFELRKGFTGTKSSLGKMFSRHALKLLRMEGSFGQHLAAGAKCLALFSAAALLPSWSGEIFFRVPHSLWIFLGLMIFGPCAHLVFEWTFKKGAGWPSVLTSAERAVGSATVLFVLSITLVAITGSDSFSGFQRIQDHAGWLAVAFPLAIPLLFAFAVVNLFTSFQTIFSRTGDTRQEGWSFNDILPFLRRTVWSLFMVDVFLGGALPGGPAGAALLVLKAVVLNVLSSAASQLFFQLREDQAESFILWRLTPISILILAITLLFPGGVS